MNFQAHFFFENEPLNEKRFFFSTYFYNHLPAGCITNFGHPVYRRLLYKVKDIQKRRMLYSRKLFEDSVQFLRVELFAKPVMAKLG